MKRALMTFANPFGLALYTSPPHTDATAEVVGLELLDPGTIQKILASVRGLPRPFLVMA